MKKQNKNQLQQNGHNHEMTQQYEVDIFAVF